MELVNNIDNNLFKTTSVTLEKQQSFLETALGKVINTALDTGIRALLPDIIEEQIINIKDAIINSGFKAGVNEAISSAVDLGKSVIGVFTGKFDNITQARNAIKSGGIIDQISKVLDSALNSCVKLGKIPTTICNILKSGKDSILDTISSNIEKSFDNQIYSIEKLENYTKTWNEFYNKQDFSGMEREFKKLEKELKKIFPLENTLKKARIIENIHTLIKNKGGKFNFSNEEMELAKKLIN